MTTAAVVRRRKATKTVPRPLEPSIRGCASSGACHKLAGFGRLWIGRIALRGVRRSPRGLRHDLSRDGDRYFFRGRRTDISRPIGLDNAVDPSDMPLAGRPCAGRVFVGYPSLRGTPREDLRASSRTGTSNFGSWVRMHITVRLSTLASARTRAASARSLIGIREARVANVSRASHRITLSFKNLPILHTAAAKSIAPKTSSKARSERVD